jgi:tRNA (guanine-N7-)-methyltransferase
MRRLPWAVEYLDSAKSLVKEPQERKSNWKENLHTDTLHVEIGCGKGGYSASLARLYPDHGVVALEVNESAAGMAAKKFDEENLDNLALIHGDAKYLTDWFAPGEIDIIHLNFSDPWPKKRNAKRRLSAPSFLQDYKILLSDNGQIQMKTDNAALFEYSLLQMEQAGYKLNDVSVDFRREEHPEDPQTEYETKFMEKGQPIYRAVWTKGNL